jgi:hypothetical protein
MIGFPGIFAFQSCCSKVLQIESFDREAESLDVGEVLPSDECVAKSVPYLSSVSGGFLAIFNIPWL